MKEVKVTSWLISIIIIAILLVCDVKAFIFDEVNDSNEKTLNVINYKYSTDCLQNDTIVTYIDTFRTKFNEIKEITADDMAYFNHHSSHANSIQSICTSKRNKARSITDFIHHIANECVKADNFRKRFILNTLLTLEFELDFMCSISESVFKAIYKSHVGDCISIRSESLDKCRKSSINVLFFDKIPSKVTLIHLLNGGICNFDYDAMKKCAEKPLDACGGASDALNYLLDVVKRNSICFKRRSVSEILENAKD